MIQPDVSIPEKQLRELRRVLDPKVYPRILASSINDAKRFGQTSIGRVIRAEIPLKVPDVKKVLRSSNATPTNLRSIIHVSRESISMKRYLPRQNRRGVTVKPRKKQPRQLLRSAFISEKLGGHVFKRVGKARTPIKREQGPTAIGVLDGVPGMLEGEEQKMQDKMIERAQSKVIAHFAGKARF